MDGGLLVIMNSTLWLIWCDDPNCCDGIIREFSLCSCGADYDAGENFKVNQAGPKVFDIEEPNWWHLSDGDVITVKCRECGKESVFIQDQSISYHSELEAT